MSMLLERRRAMAQDEGDLPVGAIPCELIYSTGYASFIDTNIIPTESMSFDVDICWVKINTTTAAAFGYYISSYGFVFYLDSSPGNVGIAYGDSHTGDWPDYRSLKLSRFKHRATIAPTGATVETYSEDGTLLNIQNLTYSKTPIFNHTIALLGRKNGDTSITTGVFRGGMGRFKLYSDATFGTLMADFVPCYYQGNFGFWEKVSKTFLIGNVPSDIYGFGEAWNTQGFSPNVRNYTSSAANGYIQDNRGTDLSPMFEIPDGCTQLQFNAGTASSDAKYALAFFKADKTYKDYYNYNTDDRIVSIPSDSKYVRLTVVTRSKIATCYIKDVTHNTYIWKGAGV